MTLAGTGRTEEMYHFGAVDEGELGERKDALPVERRLEGEVEAGERLDRGEASELIGATTSASSSTPSRPAARPGVGSAVGSARAC